MSMAAGDPMAIAERVIEENRYLTLGTADEQGNPWVSPLWYATNGYREFLWVSSADARHSKNIAARGRVALVIFDSRSPPTNARAVYIDADATELGPDLEPALRIYSAASQAHGLQAWNAEDLLPPAPGRLYRAVTTDLFALDNPDRIRIAL